MYCGVVALIRGALEMLEMLEMLTILRQRHPEVELHVIGRFFLSGFETEVRRCVAALGLHEHVTFYGRLPLDAAEDTLTY